MRPCIPITVAALAAFWQALLGQGVGIGTSTPDPSAILELSSTTKGLLIPRLKDAERQALPDPATGLLIFNTTTGELNFYNGSSWRRIPSSVVSTSSGTGTPSGEGVLIGPAGWMGTPAPSALLEVVASDKGLLIPRTTPSSIPAPSAGLAIYNTSTNHLNYYDGSAWREPCGVLIDNNKGIGAVSGAGVAINVTNTPPDPSARLDVSHSSKGLLLPRLTSAQRDALISPDAGLIIFNTTSGRIEYWQGTQWVSLMELPLQPSAITGPTTVCQGATGVSYSVTNVPGVSYNWTYSGSGFTITSGAGTNAITGNFSLTSTSGTLTVTPSNACGSGPSRSVNISINAPPGAVGPISGPSTVCPGQNYNFSINPVSGATSYAWYYNGSGPIASGTNPTIPFYFSSGSGTLSVVASNSCGSTSASMNITLITNAPGNAGPISGPIHVCRGSTYTYSITPVSGATSYVWSLPNGSTITTTTSSVTITFGTTIGSAPSGTLSVTPKNQCFSGGSSSLYLNLYSPPEPPQTISATPSTICSGGTSTLAASGGFPGDQPSSNPSGLYWYQGGCGVGTPIATGGSTIVSPTTTTTYYVRRESPCGFTTPCLSVTVNVNPSSTAPTSATATPATVCSGGSTTLNASGGNAAPGSSLVWYSGSCGGTYVGTGSPTVNPTSTTTYFVRREGGCGTPTGCASVTVTVNSTPGPGNISGQTTLCRGQSYTFTTTNNATSYNWYHTSIPGVTITGSGHTATVNTGSGGATSGTICVTPSNTCGNGDNRCISVNIITAPAAGPISGPTSVCKGKTNVTYSVPNQPGVSYSWSYSGSGMTIVSGQGTHSITANFSMTATNGTLSVTASNACGSSSTSVNITMLTPYWAVTNANCQNSNCTPFILNPNFPCTGNTEGQTAPYAECDANGTIECYGDWQCYCGP